MLYGLLLAGTYSEDEKQESLAATSAAAEEDESWCLGMEAWVSCERAPADASTLC